MPLRPCLECGALSPNSRCPRHRRIPDKRKRQRRPYTNADKKRRAQAVAEHRAQHGDWCPGWQRPSHPSTDLTADHITSVAAGGAEYGPLTVMCRSCNSSKQAST